MFHEVIPHDVMRVPSYHDTCEFSMGKEDIPESAFTSQCFVLKLTDPTPCCNPLTIIMTWSHPIAKGTRKCNSPHAQKRGDLEILRWR